MSASFHVAPSVRGGPNCVIELRERRGFTLRNRIRPPAALAAEVSQLRTCRGACRAPHQYGEVSVLKSSWITRFARHAIRIVGLMSLLTIAPVAAHAMDAPKVETGDGPIQGVYTHDVAEFLGIRYATPPVGDLRWRPPQPAAKWSETLLTIDFGNTCVQNQSGKFARPSITEDCLYLNVYTPKDYAGKAEQRPVLVWFHGGGLVAGESNDYDGSKLAGKGDSVVVTVNYRVGALGFFAHPALDGEGHDIGNYGLMDQQLALKWVQANIAKFGGDPHNLTIFGQSGGATAVMANLVSPTAAGLFQKIINQSGTHAVATPLAEAEQMGERFAAKAGCTKDVAACLRALSPATIISLGPPPANFYILDGKIITQAPYESFKRGQFNRVPILNGADRRRAGVLSSRAAGWSAHAAHGRRVQRLRGHLRQGMVERDPR